MSFLSHHENEPNLLKPFCYFLTVLWFCGSADSMLGVFHYRSRSGQYKLNYTAARQACAAEDGRVATYTQLAYAQQVSERITAGTCCRPRCSAHTCRLCWLCRAG